MITDEPLSTGGKQWYARLLESARSRTNELPIPEQLKKELGRRWVAGQWVTQIDNMVPSSMPRREREELVRQGMRERRNHLSLDLRPMAQN
ncbi:hypothetical protein [Pasteuria penetrans]|uniref:hypothetical protein n=1 Tax=Pasteuria penetrans TaxID=86005 RepID=UPI000FA1030F|nr:hypothetical protein [Pasteuria penetrans]